MKKIIFLSIAVFFGACSSKPPQPPPSTMSITAAQERALYEHGLRALSRNDFRGSAKAFVELLHRFPSTKWLSGALYNLGLALEGQNKYAEAAGKYKKVIELNQGASLSRDEADALYRLSICYEALQDDDKMTLALLQLQDKKDFLPKETAEMEVPARLAAAYAREGNLNEAKIYYAKAEKELKKYRRPPLSGDVMLWLPRTLFSMGFLKPLKKGSSVKEFNLYIDSLKESQGWLVRAAELGNNNTWSKKAAENLEDIYLSCIVAIRDFTGEDLGDKMLASQKRQQSQKEMARLLDSSIALLKVERLPPSPAEPESKLLTAAFETIAQVERNATQVIMGRDVRDQVTPEAKVHESLRQ